MTGRDEWLSDGRQGDYRPQEVETCASPKSNPRDLWPLING